MSYSLNDNFYIDTETSTARLQGNLDLQNSIRFNKTDTEEGIVIQANIIKERLTETPYIPNEIGTQFNTRIINNVINSNNLQIQIMDTYMNLDNTQVILQLRNTDLNNTYILPLLGNNYISIPQAINCIINWIQHFIHFSHQLLIYHILEQRMKIVLIFNTINLIILLVMHMEAIHF